jgi:hypothetical protein
MRLVAIPGAAYFRGLPRLANTTPWLSTACRSRPASFNASLRRGPGGMARASSSAFVAMSSVGTASALRLLNEKSDENSVCCFAVMSCLGRRLQFAGKPALQMRDVGIPRYGQCVNVTALLALESAGVETGWAGPNAAKHRAAALASGTARVLGRQQMG